MQRFFNNFSTTLRQSLLAGETSIATAEPIPLPDGDWCYLTIETMGNGGVKIEIVKAKSVGGQIVLTRAQDGTSSPAEFLPNSIVECRITAADLRNFADKVARAG